MELHTVDYQLARLSQLLAGVWQMLGDLETWLCASRLQSIAIDRPIFITGLARAGTTILLEELSKAAGTATHQYRDFPFLMTPVSWNWCRDRLQKAVAPVERPHQDRIQITPASPEAFEEPLWRHFFPQWNDAGTLHRLDAHTKNPEFETFYRDHLRKILLLRRGRRYLSKGNYNFSRIEYLGAMFPDAQFVIPVRDPVEHVHSLVRQHQLFCQYARQDWRIPHYLTIAGHFEFGPQRQPLKLTERVAERTVERWLAGDDHGGYAVQWSATYGFLREITTANPELGQRLTFVRYEDLCDDPLATMRQILARVELPADSICAQSVSHISRANASPGQFAKDIVRHIRDETGAVARSFGYPA